MPLLDLAFREGEDDRLLKAGSLIQRCRVLLITGKAIETFRDDDVDLAPPQGFEQAW